MDRRRERGLKTRDSLIAASLTLFSQNGYESTTINAIVKHASVSQRTFFHHFPSKEYVLFDGYTERLDAATSQFRSTPMSESLWYALSKASLSVIDAIEEHPDAFLHRVQLYAHVNAIRELMLRINEDWIESMATEVGQRLNVNPEDRVGPRLSAMLANAANRSALDVWARSGGRVGLRRIATESLDLIRPAVAEVERTAHLSGSEQYHVV